MAIMPLNRSEMSKMFVSLLFIFNYLSLISESRFRPASQDFFRRLKFLPCFFFPVELETVILSAKLFLCLIVVNFLWFVFE